MDGVASIFGTPQCNADIVGGQDSDTFGFTHYGGEAIDYKIITSDNRTFEGIGFHIGETLSFPLTETIDVLMYETKNNNLIFQGRFKPYETSQPTPPNSDPPSNQTDDLQLLYPPNGFTFPFKAETSYLFYWTQVYPSYNLMMYCDAFVYNITCLSNQTSFVNPFWSPSVYWKVRGIKSDGSYSNWTETFIFYPTTNFSSPILYAPANNFHFDFSDYQLPQTVPLECIHSNSSEFHIIVSVTNATGTYFIDSTNEVTNWYIIYTMTRTEQVKWTALAYEKSEPYRISFSEPYFTFNVRIWY